jgi:hypothetical protein
MTKFSRLPYRGVSFVRSGCTVKVFLPENESHGWCLSTGFSIVTGFKSRREAVEAAPRFIA